MSRISAVNEFSRDATRRSSGGSAAPASQAGLMLSRQKELKRLPVAPLQDTLKRYLDSVRPLLTAEEFANTQKVSMGLGTDGGCLLSVLAGLGSGWN
ncbi:hypothetical protein IscW_ISCW002796 [Ixodes scapularis]|uniref:Choline/carnitine acyltransferase domain-containing protein n=1 Tax=Ixodes scapularis TaxID=6945 RepID=B7PCJ0_IXOSC|nr:hypothetical protein IscW_ISCW002796 [Ixodes scapularis]|eukprot:XP_002409914.1 hypothetical protein IscW_ISCW002796 [Ixodes scapularis]